MVERFYELKPRIRIHQNEKTDPSSVPWNDMDPQPWWNNQNWQHYKLADEKYDILADEKYDKQTSTADQNRTI